MRKNIIIVGYPKSGTTWVSRLVAELVNCPLLGGWGFENIEALYKEGEHRESLYHCYKSHHLHENLKKSSRLPIHKIIYVIRDPRDIVISGTYYFDISTKLFLYLNKIKRYRLSSFLKYIFNKFLPVKLKKEQMIKAVLFGNIYVSNWYETSWKSHINSYVNKEIIFVKYEDLVDEPLVESKRILSYLNIEIDDKKILKSIENQSFKIRNQEVFPTNKEILNKLLRKGTYGYWKNELSQKEIEMFKVNLNVMSNFYKF